MKRERRRRRRRKCMSENLKQKINRNRKANDVIMATKGKQEDEEKRRKQTENA